MENVSWLTPVAARVFVTTRWTVITACTQADEAKAQAALKELCQSYWQPVYVCIRHRGYAAHDAQDLTQDFFLRLLKGTWLPHLDEAKGRFRAYLSVALRNFLSDQRRSRWALKRGRGSSVVPIEAREAEDGYASVDGGAAGYHVTSTGYSLLPRDAQQVVAANPLKYRLDDETLGTLAAKQQPIPAMQTPQADAATAQAARQTWQDQQRAVLTEFPNVAKAGSAASQTFARAFSRVGNDPRKALAVARAVFGGG